MAATALDDQNGYRMVARWPGGWHGLVPLIPYGLLAIGNLCVLLGWICNACEDAGTSMPYTRSAPWSMKRRSAEPTDGRASEQAA